MALNLDAAVQSYLDARDEMLDVELAKAHWMDNEKAFVAGVQYALDHMLHGMSKVAVPGKPLWYEHMLAEEVLEQVKGGTFKQ